MPQPESKPTRSFECHVHGWDLPPGGYWPPISVVVNVAANAASNVVNQATVSGGDNPSPVTVSDPSTVVRHRPFTSPRATLELYSGAGRKLYRDCLQLAGTTATGGTVTMTENMPPALTLITALNNALQLSSMQGSGSVMFREHAADQTVWHWAGATDRFQGQPSEFSEGVGVGRSKQALRQTGEGELTQTLRKFFDFLACAGSAGKVILCSFLKDEDFGFESRHSLSLQEQITQVFVTAAAT